MDTIHSQLGYKNSDVIPKKATCVMMLFSVPIALLERGNEGQLGSHVALQFFFWWVHLHRVDATWWEARSHFFVKKAVPVGDFVFLC